MPLNSRTNKGLPLGKKGVLYVVATPIGNMRDITLRALDILAGVDLVAAEDTRRTLKLLSANKITARLVSYHEHNEDERIPSLIEKLQGGASIALVSDAGTPAVSDPGYRLVTAAIHLGIDVVPIPGVSAPVTALSVAGLPTDSFVFVGFPARKNLKRQKQLSGLASEPRTIVFYESPRRILSLLKEIISLMGDRKAVLAREMTKRYEEFIRGSLSDIHDRLKTRSAIKGEFTLLVAGRDENGSVWSDAVRDEIRRCLDTGECGISELSRSIAEKHGLSRTAVYAEALSIRGKTDHGSTDGGES
jgi:16S rRNA (cytidine1402-2'-O)-methyltransferase